MLTPLDETLHHQAPLTFDHVDTTDHRFYDRQLIGLRVLDPTGAQVGKVTAVIHHGGEQVTQDLLDVAMNSGEQRLIPFVSALVPTIDLDAGSLTVAEVAGLLVDPVEPEEDA